MNKKLLFKLNNIEYSIYNTHCCLDVIKTYISAVNNENLNKLEFIINTLITQNNKLHREIEYLWKDAL